jgi:nitrate reductase molybdenum cofactor assembly chaperone NarJ/NarW
MAPVSHDSYCALADAFAYPSPGLRPALAANILTLPPGPVQEDYMAFVQKLSRLSLGEWEELYTTTFDLNPLVAPYLGYHAWGESYRRGPFLGRMNRALQEAGVETMGELPDHIAPVLRYLAATPAPLPELLEVLNPAVDRMVSTLQKAEPGNPYVDLMQAVQTYLVIAAGDAARRTEEAT